MPWWAEDDEDLDDLLDELDWDVDPETLKETVSKLEEFLIAIGQVAAAYSLDVVNIDSTSDTLSDSEQSIADSSTTYAQDYARNRSAELIGKQINDDGSIVDNPDAKFAISDSTREEVKDTIADAIANGDSNDDLADSLDDAYAFGKDRSTMIARTETNIADNDITYNTYKNAGVQKKAWLTAQDDLVSDECQANEDQEAIDIDDDFSSGDDSPPCHPNCRCTLLAVFDEDAE